MHSKKSLIKRKGSWKKSKVSGKPKRKTNYKKRIKKRVIKKDHSKKRGV